MNSIFDEFRLLAAGNSEAIELIDLLESEQLEIRERRALACRVWALIVPPCPKGRRHLPDSYWGKASAKFIHWGLFGHKPEVAAKWMRENRTHKKTAFFQPVPYLPQPRTGK